MRVAVPVKLHSQTLKVQFRILFPCHRVCSFLSLCEPFKSKSLSLACGRRGIRQQVGVSLGRALPPAATRSLAASSCPRRLRTVSREAGTEPSFGEPSCWHSHTLQGQMSSDPFLEKTTLAGGP